LSDVIPIDPPWRLWVSRRHHLLLCRLPLLLGDRIVVADRQALFSTDLVPHSFDFRNYVAVFAEQPFGRNILNSLLVAGTTVLLSLAPGSAGLAMHWAASLFAGAYRCFSPSWASRCFPQIAVLSGMFEIIQALGLYNRLLGLRSATFSSPCRSPSGCDRLMRDLPRESKRPRWSMARHRCCSSGAYCCR